MKILKWLFGFSEQRAKQQKKYAKASTSGKITEFIIYLIFAVGAILCLVFIKDIFAVDVVLGIFTCMVIIAIPSMLSKECFINSSVCFSNIAFITANKMVTTQIEKELNKNYDVLDGEIVKREEKLSDEEASAKVKPIKIKKGVDITLGILYIILPVSLIISLITIFFTHVVVLISNAS